MDDNTIDCLYKLIGNRNYKILKLFFESESIPISQSLNVIKNYYNKYYADACLFFSNEIFIFLIDYIQDEQLACDYLEIILKIYSADIYGYDIYDFNEIIVKLLDMISSFEHINKEYIHLLPKDIFLDYAQNNIINIDYNFFLKCMGESENEIILWVIDQFNDEMMPYEKVKLITNYIYNKHNTGDSNLIIIYDYFRNIIDSNKIYDILIIFIASGYVDEICEFIPDNYKMDDYSTLFALIHNNTIMIEKYGSYHIINQWKDNPKRYDLRAMLPYDFDINTFDDDIKICKDFLDKNI